MLHRATAVRETWADKQKRPGKIRGVSLGVFVFRLARDQVRERERIMNES